MACLEVNANFELCWGNNSPLSLAITVDQPVWASVEEGLEKCFKNGGFIRLTVVSPETSFIRQLSMKSLPGRFRLCVLPRFPKPKEGILEWWEPTDSTFAGVTIFGGDSWDSRTICTNITVAREIFFEFFQTGDLVEGLSQMRSPWNPKP